MKYLKLFEKFNAKAVASTLSFLKKNNIHHSRFLIDIRKLLKSSVAINKINDEDFEYLPAKKAAYLTAPGSKNGIHSIKYWFSLEKGYLGQTLTKSRLSNFVEDMVVKYENNFGIIRNVTDSIEIEMLDGKTTTINDAKELKLLTKSEQNEYEKLTRTEGNNTVPVQKIINDITFGDQYKIDVPTLEKCLANLPKRSRKLLLFKKDDKYEITEIEKNGTDIYLLTTKEHGGGDNWLTEENSSPFIEYTTLSDGRYRITLDMNVRNILFANNVILVDNNNELMGEEIGLELLTNDQKIVISDTTGIKIIKEKVANMHPNLTVCKLRLLKYGWTKMKVKNTNEVQGYAWVYKNDFSTSFIVYDDTNLWSGYNELDFNHSKFGKYSRRLTSHLGTSMDFNMTILNIFAPNNIFTMFDVKTNISDINQENKNMTFGGISDIPEKADFALVLDSDILGNEDYNTTDKKGSRKDAKNNALGFKDNITVRDENFQRYADEIVKRANVTHEDFNNMNFSNIINRLLGKKDTFIRIYFSEYSKFNDVFSYLSTAANFMESGDEGRAQAYIDHVKNIINVTYKVAPSESSLFRQLANCEKSFGKDEKYKFVERLIKISDLINKKIKDSNIKTLHDVEMVRYNLTKLTSLLVNGSTYKLINLDDLFYSIKASYEYDARTYMTRMNIQTLKINNKKLDLLEEYIKNMNFTS